MYYLDLVRSRIVQYKQILTPSNSISLKITLTYKIIAFTHIHTAKTTRGTLVPRQSNKL